ncbi:MAG: hypothetical protein ACR2PQ_12355, partial [Myxococcota bacterium]
RAMLWARDLTITRSAVATAVANIVLVLPSFTKGLRGIAAYEDFAPEFDYEARPFRITSALISEIERESREAGAEFYLVGAGGEWGRALRETLELPSLGVADRFGASIPEGAQLIVPFDSHMNALGHELYGVALADSLREADLAGPVGR